MIFKIIYYLNNNKKFNKNNDLQDIKLYNFLYINNCYD